MIDLHSHSNASDGLMSPVELVSYASSLGLSVLAITDHDTVAGLETASKTASKFHLTFVPGIEINIQWPTGEFHLLGYGLRSISEELKTIISKMQYSRRNRNEEIIALMKKSGIDISLEQMEMLYSTKSIGRPHFADFMLKNKIVKKRQAAFDLYLAKGRPWYVPHAGAELDDAVKAIKLSGAVPVIAHPLSLYISWGKIEPVLTDLHARGIEGLEAWHPGARVSSCVRLEKLARQIGFFITAGSDFHGKEVRVDRKLGKTSGDKKIDDSFWYDELLPHLQSSSYFPS